jgi:hypothetical protein
VLTRSAFAHTISLPRPEGVGSAAQKIGFALTTGPGNPVVEVPEHSNRAGAGCEFLDRGIGESKFPQEACLKEQFQNLNQQQEPCAGRCPALERRVVVRQVVPVVVDCVYRGLAVGNQVVQQVRKLCEK